MKYISKGAVLRPCTEEILYVSRCGSEYALPKPMSTLWLEGRLRVGLTRTEVEEMKLARLQSMGLVEVAEDESKTAQYRMMTHCVILPAKLKRMPRHLNRTERYFWKWINQSGMHLTMAELVYLSSKGIWPDSSMLGKDNVQNLTERIYTADTIRDRVLDIEMEKSDERDSAVSAVLGLLRKKHLILV